jgi:hypothetical protein
VGNSCELSIEPLSSNAGKLSSVLTTGAPRVVLSSIELLSLVSFFLFTFITFISTIHLQLFALRSSSCSHHEFFIWNYGHYRQLVGLLGHGRSPKT